MNWFLDLLNLLSGALADERTHKFKEDEDLVLWVNKIGPYHNPQEKYEYYSLPFCKPDVVKERSEGLGESLIGYELVSGPFKLAFKKDQESMQWCNLKLDRINVETFVDAVKNEYWFEFFIDDLPVWGMLGEFRNKKAYIYTHYMFTLTYNKDRVIEVKLETTSPTLIDVTKTDVQLPMTYAVKWLPSKISYEHRFDRYLDNTFFEHQIHWFSIFNSFVMLVFLIGLVALILFRTLKKDFIKIARDFDDEEEGLDVIDETGWKQIHGDVFRAPAKLTLFSALLGTGSQLAILFAASILFSIGFYRNRGSILSAFVVCYAFTAFIAGYISNSFYMKHGGKKWLRNVVVTATLFPGFIFLLGFLLNFVAIGYHSLTAVPFGTVVVIILIWGFIALPLTFGGALAAKEWSSTPDFPCRINPLPRPIDESQKQWYQHRWVLILASGIMPFSSIFIEMFFVFSALWQHKFYYVFGFLALVYIILIAVTICITIVMTYFFLNSEDYRWHWTSFLGAASTGLYIYLYGIYYFGKTKMNGFLQTVYYFGYTAMFCFGIALLCGAVGFLGTQIFVRKIYKGVKRD
jgi:transmembrane 9 superfamily protein 3